MGQLMYPISASASCQFTENRGKCRRVSERHLNRNNFTGFFLTVSSLLSMAIISFLANKSENPELKKDFYFKKSTTGKVVQSEIVKDITFKNI
jgi:hypothetical protein